MNSKIYPFTPLKLSAFQNGEPRTLQGVRKLLGGLPRRANSGVERGNGGKR
jgi:hypothetical protein